MTKAFIECFSFADANFVFNVIYVFKYQFNTKIIFKRRFFKQATQGDCIALQPDDSDIIALAKWSAWHSNLGLTPIDAMNRYIQLLDSLQDDWKEHLNQVKDSELPQNRSFSGNSD